jgi:deoxyadenosine/deoxycytidine kinase
MGYICFLDRSLFGNNVFTSLNHDLDNIDDEDFELLQRMITEYPYMECVDELIYVRTPPNICQKRMLLRGREVVDLPYLVQLDQKYLELLPTVLELSQRNFDWSKNLIEGLEFLDTFVHNAVFDMEVEQVERTV